MPLKPLKPLKPLPPLVSSSSSSQSGASDAGIQCRIGLIEPDIPETRAALDAVAGDEDENEDENEDEDEDEDENTEVLLCTMREAWSILASVAESQGCTVDALTGEEVQQAVIQAYYLCTAPSDPVDGGISSSSTF